MVGTRLSRWRSSRNLATTKVCPYEIPGSRRLAGPKVTRGGCPYIPHTKLRYVIRSRFGIRDLTLAFAAPNVGVSLGSPELIEGWVPDCCACDRHGTRQPQGGTLIIPIRRASSDVSDAYREYPRATQGNHPLLRLIFRITSRRLGLLEL
jgi:hypothetical protein